MRIPKPKITGGCLAFLCAYAVFDPYGSFWLFLVSVAFHEGAHILAMCFFRKKILTIECGLGGLLIRTEPMSYLEELLTAAAGPVANLCLFLLSVGKFPVAAIVNGVLFAYNLLPIYPLDGGRILRSCLRMCLPISLCDGVERAVCLCAFGFLIAGGLYGSFVLHSGLWPVLFCGFLMVRVGETVFPERKNNSL